MLLKRAQVAELLGVSERRSFDILPSDTSLGFITSGRVIAFFNAVRNKTMPCIRAVPMPIGIDEAARMAGVDTRTIALWTKRQRRPCPCWRASQKTVLFDAYALREWLVAHGVPVHPQTTTTTTQENSNG